LDLRGRKWREGGEDCFIGELHNLYASPDIIRVIRSRRMRRVVHVARMEKMRNAYIMLIGNSEAKIPLRETWLR
jgi:hypothetical protein